MLGADRRKLVPEFSDDAASLRRPEVAFSHLPRVQASLLTGPTAAAQAYRRQLVLMLRVFGRLPITDVTRFSEAGVRKASGEETAGEFAPTLVSIYGEFAAAA